MSMSKISGQVKIEKKELSDDIMFPSEKIVVSNMEILNDLIGA